MSTTSTGERRVIGNVLKGSVGNLIEWYDWYVYAAFSVFFAKEFFPEGDTTAQLLSTAAVFAVGFLMRPIGGWSEDHCERGRAGSGRPRRRAPAG